MFCVIQDDRWRPMNHLNEKDCTKFVDEMASAGIDLTEYVYGRFLNPVALRKAKIVCNFGLSECNIGLR